MRQVEIPYDYFYNMSKKDYSHFETALIREFFQNSYDAGAKQVVFDYDAANGELTIFDDGIGMDYDTIINKLLVMGMSHKDSDNAVGAFGHAKILLYFSWGEWQIRSRNIIVKGSSHYYTIEETDDYIDGTISTITVGKKLSSFSYFLNEYFTYCETTCSVFYVENGSTPKLVKQTYERGEKIFTDENFDIFKSGQTGYYIIVRQKGVMMFKEYVGGNQKNSGNC